MDDIKKKNRDRSKLVEIVHPDAAGIDIGSEEHYVCVPLDRDGQNVRKFACFTADLHRLVDWLIKCGINTVAMESTGVYWIPLYQILEDKGIKVFLVNSRYVKNVPGKKSDVQDCQWLQQLHTFGLLSASFRPSQEICELRSYSRQRQILTESSSAHIQRMQKALTQMNLQLHKVISDISGETGMKIIEAMLGGERDPRKLAELKSYKIRSSVEAIQSALTGDYREEHLFILKQEYEFYQYCRNKIAECDQKIEQWLNRHGSQQVGTSQGAKDDGTNKKAKKYRKHEPKFELHNHLIRITGVDLTQIDGLDSLSVLKILSEVGTDMGKWRTEKHFASWLGLCPNNKITGGKIKSSKSKRIVNHATQTFRMAAFTLSHSKSALGAFYRRMKIKLGSPKAITATANKIAKIFYRMLKHGKPYVDLGAQYYEEKYRDRAITGLKKRAAELGLQVLEIQISATPEGAVS